MATYQGIIPPVITPFTADGAVDFDIFRANFTRWNHTDLRGYLILGSNAEYVYLSREEKLRLLETARGVVPQGKLMIAGTGSESTADTIQLTKDAARLGADAVMVVTPCYYKGQMTHRVLLEHYRRVADASPVPLFLYNVPQFTGVVLSPDLVGQLATHPNIVGMKDSAGNVGICVEYIRAAPEDFAIFIGSAAVLVAGLAMGAKGGILALANCAPEACLTLYTLCRAGKWDEARRVQLRLLPAIKAVTSTFGISGLKAAMDLMGYRGGFPRPPLLPVTDKVRGEISGILTSAGLLVPEGR